jgi:hypothetical protein
MNPPKLHHGAGPTGAHDPRDVIASVRCQECHRPVTLVLMVPPDGEAPSSSWTCPWCEHTHPLHLPRHVLALAGDAHSAI